MKHDLTHLKLKPPYFFGTVPTQSELFNKINAWIKVKQRKTTIKGKLLVVKNVLSYEFFIHEFLFKQAKPKGWPKDR